MALSKPASWKNLTSEGPNIAWDFQDVAGSLQKVNKYAEELAAFAIKWYYKKKGHKARFSRVFRYGAILSTSLAGLLPVITTTWPNSLNRLIATPGNDKLLVSLLVGLAATLVALDRFAGYSTAWIRYIRAGADINKLLQEYRFDWVKLTSEAKGDLASQAANMLARTREFILAVQSVVIQETQAWANEFESSLSDMEKSAKEQSDKQVQELQAKLDSVQPGSLFVSVTNLVELDNSKFKIIIFSNREKIAEASDQTGVWQQLGVVPGIYTVQLSASIGGEPVFKTLPVTIEAGKPKHENAVLRKAGSAVV